MPKEPSNSGAVNLATTVKMGSSNSPNISIAPLSRCKLLPNKSLTLR